MRIIILGAGAIGSLLGAYITKTGNKVVLVGREDHVNKINLDGLNIITDKDNFTIPVPAVSDLSSIKFEQGDIVFLAIKSEDINEAIKLLNNNCPAGIPVFCLQNGVGTEEIVSKHFNNVYGGVVFFSGTYLDPGKIIYTRVDKIGIGLYKGGIDNLTQQVNDILLKAGFGSFAHESIMAVKWSKLVIVLSMAVSAIAGLSGPETVSNKDSRALVADITEEAMNVIKTAGIELADAPGRPALSQHIAMLKSTDEFGPVPEIPEELKHRPSLWQDLASQRGKTEIDYLNGEIVKLGEKFNIPTPLNSLCVKIVKDMAMKREMPGKHSIAELRKMI